VGTASIQLYDLGYLVVLRIDDNDLLIGHEKSVRPDLRRLLGNVARYWLQPNVIRHLVAHCLNLGRGWLNLHILDDLFDDVTLFQCEVQLWQSYQRVLRCGLRMNVRGDARQHQHASGRYQYLAHVFLLIMRRHQPLLVLGAGDRELPDRRFDSLLLIQAYGM
jgi:hypothetical protein